MTKKQIVVGEVYAVKVSGQLVPVKVIAENRLGGWDGRNLLTNRAVRLKTAGRFRKCLTDKTVDGADVCPICGRRCETTIYRDGSKAYMHKAHVGRVGGKLMLMVDEQCFEPARQIN
jgi:hypothetical protein